MQRRNFFGKIGAVLGVMAAAPVALMAQTQEATMGTRDEGLDSLQRSLRRAVEKCEPMQSVEQKRRRLFPSDRYEFAIARYGEDSEYFYALELQHTYGPEIHNITVTDLVIFQGCWAQVDSFLRDIAEGRKYTAYIIEKYSRKGWTRRLRGELDNVVRPV